MQDIDVALKIEFETIVELSGKVFAADAEGSALPYLTYQLSSTERDRELDVNFNGLVNKQFQTDIVNTTYANTKSLLKVTIAKVKTLWGRTIGVDGPYIQAVETISEVGPYYESTVKRYHGVIEFSVTYEEE